LTITAPVWTENTLPITANTTSKWCDPKTVTLEQIDENTQRLLWEWPKDNGTPFPMEILEVLRDLKLRVMARDAENNCSVMVSEATNTDTAGAICTPAPVNLVVIDTIKPNTPIPDLISTTTSNPMYPTTAIANIWWKTERKAAKTAYQNIVVKNGYPLMANQAVIDQATKTVILMNTSVEQHNAELCEMEMAWCRKKTNPFPDHICTVPNHHLINTYSNHNRKLEHGEQTIQRGAGGERNGMGMENRGRGRSYRMRGGATGHGRVGGGRRDLKQGAKPHPITYSQRHVGHNDGA
jgi:hypothetical protein